tara:strand:- start:217 stop:441 length:225 start_codon:yes stop_codon:yes gene_type:complete
MLKFFLVGWVCIGTGIDQSCLRVASEITHATYPECNDYYEMVQGDLNDLDDYITLSFSCVQAASLEDVLYKKET